MYDSTVAELSFEMRAAKRRAPNPSQAGGRDIRLREVALQHDLCYVGRATGVSEDGAELLVESDSVADTMAKIESFPDDRRRHLSSFVASPAAPPADSPPWLLDDPDAQSFEDLPPMEAEPVVTLPACEAHPLRSVPLRPPSEGAALAAEAGAGDARADQHVSTVIFSCGFQQNFEALVSMAQPLSDADGYPFATRGVSDVAKVSYADLPRSPIRSCEHRLTSPDLLPRQGPLLPRIAVAAQVEVGDPPRMRRGCGARGEPHRARRE